MVAWTENWVTLEIIDAFKRGILGYWVIENGESNRNSKQMQIMSHKIYNEMHSKTLTL